MLCARVPLLRRTGDRSKKSRMQSHCRRAWLAMLRQNAWMPGTARVQPRKSSDMRYSRRVLRGPLGRHTCSWCRWLLHAAARAPRMIFPGCARPAWRSRTLSPTSVCRDERMRTRARRLPSAAGADFHCKKLPLAGKNKPHDQAGSSASQEFSEKAVVSTRPSQCQGAA